MAGFLFGAAPITLARQRAAHGFGIAIARELAERNGSTLRLDPEATGASYVFELPGVRAVAPAQR